MRTKLFMYFCIKTYFGTQVGVCTMKGFNPPPLRPVVYTTDRSNEVVPMSFLFCVAL